MDEAQLRQIERRLFGGEQAGFHALPTDGSNDGWARGERLSVDCQGHEALAVFVSNAPQDIRALVEEVRRIHATDTQSRSRHHAEWSGFTLVSVQPVRQNGASLDGGNNAMPYAFEHAYGSNIQVAGLRIGLLHLFPCATTRDAWVRSGPCDGPGEREALTDKQARPQLGLLKRKGRCVVTCAERAQGCAQRPVFP